MFTPKWKAKFLLAVCCKTASTNANSAIFVQLFCNLLTLNWCFMHALVASMVVLLASSSLLLLVVATCPGDERMLKCQKVVKKLHRMWNWDDIKKRLVACARTRRGDEQTSQIEMKYMWILFHWFKKDSASLILVHPILLFSKNKFLGKILYL